MPGVPATVQPVLVHADCVHGGEAEAVGAAHHVITQRLQLALERRGWLEMSMASDVAEKRGALTASTMVMSKSSAFSVACSTPMAICVAPGAPMMSSGLPSLNTIEGTTELKRALPGAIEPARPGRGSNTPMQPLYMKPRPGVTTPEGMPSEWVMVKQLPSLSSTEMCVVSLVGAPPLKRGEPRLPGYRRLS